MNYTVYDELHPVEGMLLSHLMYRSQDFIEGKCILKYVLLADTKLQVGHISGELRSK